LHSSTLEIDAYFKDSLVLLLIFEPLPMKIKAKGMIFNPRPMLNILPNLKLMSFFKISVFDL